MRAWTNKLATFANVVPSTWLLGALAALIAAGLLSAFVDALHENLRRGEALRLAQGRPLPTLAGEVDTTVAQAAQQVPRLR